MGITENRQCLNCGAKAPGNYCPQCGQKTQLHNESFFGLIIHFFSHYFHYESKFWKTLGTLWVKPGELTLAYKRKQRAKYVPPMSLYIFIVIAYFLLSGLIDSIYERQGWINSADLNESEQVDASRNRPSIAQIIYGKEGVASLEKKIDEKHTDEQMDKLGPKVFFFMIPIVALLFYCMLFWKKEYHFIDHAVFTLHIQSFFFSIFIFTDLFAFLPFYDLLVIIALVILMIYTIVAMTKVYGIHWGLSIVSTLLVARLAIYALAIIIAGVLIYLI